MKHPRRYAMERLHYIAWRIAVLDTHENSESPFRQNAAWWKARQIERMILIVSRIGPPKGYMEHRKLTKRELVECKRMRRIAKRNVTSH